MADATRTLGVKWTGDTSSLEKSTAQASKKVGAFSGSLSKIGTTAAGVFTGQGMLDAGKQVVSFLEDSVQKAQEDQQSQTALARTLKNTTGARKDDIAQVEKWISKQSKATGVVDDELRPALGTLVRATGNARSGFKELQLAQDVAAGSGKDLQSVAGAIAKAQGGNYGALKRLVPTLDLTKAKTQGMTYVQAKLNETFGGQAAAAANTSAGKMKRLQVQWQEMQEQIGYKVLPVLTAVADFLLNKLPVAIQATIDWFKRIYPGVVGALQPVISFFASYVRAIVLYVQGIIQVFQGLIQFIRAVFSGDWGKAWDGLVKMFGGFVKIFAGMWDALWAYVKLVFTLAWRAIITLFQYYIKLWVLLIRTYFNIVISLAQGLVSFLGRVLSTAWNGLINGLRIAWSAVVSFFKGLPAQASAFIGNALSFGGSIGSSIVNGITGAFTNLGSALGSIIRGAINYVIDAYNALDLGIHFTIPGWVPGVGGKTFGIDDIFPDIRRLATGGVTTQAGLAYLHANEAVIPLSRAPMTMAGNTYNINVNVPAVANPAAVGAAIVTAVREYEKRNGASWRTSSTRNA